MANQAINQPFPPNVPTTQGQVTTTGSVASLPISENTRSGTVDTEKLKNMSPEEQKQYLGELIYPGVVAHDETNAGKITGMLLELDIQELLQLLEDNNELHNKIMFVIIINFFLIFFCREAQNVLRDAQQGHQ
jgi:hypothetical protein